MSETTATRPALPTPPPHDPPQLPGRIKLLWAPRFLRRHNLQLWLGLFFLGVIVLTCAIGPLLSPYGPTQQDMTARLQGFSSAHWLGTDHLGRDILTRLMYGGRTDIAITVLAVLTPFVIGTVLGAACGYFGGWFDALVMRLADIVQAFPFYVLVIALVSSLGNGIGSIFAAISLVSWVAYARIVRGETMVLRDREFIDACRTAGFSSGRIVLGHVVPNTVNQAIVYAMSDIAMNISVIVTLSYFGLGITPPTPDWGQMMADGRAYMTTGQYALTTIPGLVVVAFSFGLSLVGDGLATKLRAKR